MKTINCGDANPDGNIAMFFKGGCGKELKIEDAYRCAGCGGYFHRDCLFEHFELEAGHDYSRNALKRIKDILKYSYTHQINGDFKIALLGVVDEGLERKPVKKSFGFPFEIEETSPRGKLLSLKRK
jgi:hypothetical protein